MTKVRLQFSDRFDELIDEVKLETGVEALTRIFETFLQCMKDDPILREVMYAKIRDNSFNKDLELAFKGKLGKEPIPYREYKDNVHLRRKHNRDINQ
jgi:hypothetical protein